MEVVIYARHSSDKQITSSHDQIARCEVWCQQKGYQVNGIYRDEAISGASMQNRPGLQRLIKYSLKDRFDKIICEDLSRISRDLEDIASFYKKMAFIDIAIETVTEGEINELHIGLKGTMNALYLKDLSDKTKRGMTAAVLSGSVPGGRAYGYDLVREYRNGQTTPGLRRINEAEAVIVRGIFSDYVTGMTLKQICEKLNLQAIPSPKGKKWYQTTLVGTASRNTGILRQSLYKGVVTYNKIAYRKHPETGKRLAVPRPEEEWISARMPELAILDKTQFDRTQELLRERSSLRKKRKESLAVMTIDEKRCDAKVKIRELRCNQTKKRRYPLQLISRKLYCSDHGLSIRSIRSKRYNCPDRSCQNRNLHRAMLVGLTQRSMKQLKVTDLKQYFTSKQEEKVSLLEKKAGLTAKIDQKRQEITTLLELLSSQKTGRETLRFLDEKEKGCLRLVYEIEELQKKIDKCSYLPTNKLREIISKFQEMVNQNEKEPENEQVLEQLNKIIEQVEISSVFDKDERKFATEVKAKLNMETLIQSFYCY